MAWTIELTPQAERQLGHIGTAPASRIVKTLQARIATREDPRLAGQALVGEWTGYWRYRIGDYRVIAQIKDEKLVIIVVRIAHRREAYR